MTIHRSKGHGPRVMMLVLGLGLAATQSGFRAAIPPYDEEFPQENAWARITPSVIWCDDPASTVTIEVHIIGRSDVSTVEVTNPTEELRVALYDDGTHGDPVGGDRIFTRSEVSLKCYTSGLKYGRAVGTWTGMLRVGLKNGRTAGNDYGFSVGTVHPRFKGAFQVREMGSGLSATAYAFFMDDSRHEVFPSYPVTPITCGKSNFEAYRKLYSVLPDEFDFVSLMPGLQLFSPPDLGENVPYQVFVSSAVEHIGLPIVDKSSTFGSAGRLKSALYSSFATIQVMDHELAHNWGAAIGQKLGLVESGQQSLHWSKWSDIGGQLGAYYFAPDGQVGRFADNGNGTWHLTPNTEVVPYSPLELYVMGLLPPEEVPPMHILSAPDLSVPGKITASSVRTLTIDDVIAAEGGVRSPGIAEAQRDFRMAFMVVQDGPYSDASYAFFSLLSYALMSRSGPEERDSLAPFFWATGGRATLNTRLPVDLPEPEGLPEMPAPTATATPSEPADMVPGPVLEATTVPGTPPPASTPPPPPTPPATATRTPLREGLARCGLAPTMMVVGIGMLGLRRSGRGRRR